MNGKPKDLAHVVVDNESKDVMGVFRTKQAANAAIAKERREARKVGADLDWIVESHEIED